MRKVVVTGLGAVTPLGNSVNETWEGIKAGKSGIGLITKFDATDYACKIAGEVKDFDPTNYMDKKDARKMGLYSQYAVAAAKMALEDAGLSKETIDGDRTGVLLGNGIGGFEILEAGYKKYFEAGNTRIPPLTIPQLITNEAPGNVSMLFGLHGTALSLATACASGTDALGVALDQVRSGRLDMCLAGGTEATVTGFGIGSFQVLKTLATSYNDCPEKASRPFDAAREGFIMGEVLLFLCLKNMNTQLLVVQKSTVNLQVTAVQVMLITLQAQIHLEKVVQRLWLMQLKMQESNQKKCNITMLTEHQLL